MNLPKIVSRRTLLIIVLAGFSLYLAPLFYFVPKILIQSSSASLMENALALPKQEQASFGLPLRLKIPSINVNAVVEHMGLTSDGAMDVPESPDNVAWFELGPHPGENGSAVMAGHYGWKNGKGSVFDDLYKLREGDKLYVEDDKGTIISFVVRGNRRYDPGADVPEVFDSNDGKSHLNLITCEGIWDKASKTYSERLVVFTDKE